MEDRTYEVRKTEQREVKKTEQRDVKKTEQHEVKTRNAVHFIIRLFQHHQLFFSLKEAKHTKNTQNETELTAIDAC